MLNIKLNPFLCRSLNNLFLSKTLPIANFFGRIKMSLEYFRQHYGSQLGEGGDDPFFPIVAVLERMVLGQPTQAHPQ